MDSKRFKDLCCLSERPEGRLAKGKVGSLDMDALPRLIGERTKLLAVTLMSHVLGTINDVRSIVSLAHERGVPVLAVAVVSLDVNLERGNR